jgi:hypothetical protein
MSSFLKIALGDILLLSFLVGLCFGHACHDPWRPTPANPGSGPSAPPPPAPPPPPPPVAPPAALPPQGPDVAAGGAGSALANPPATLPSASTVQAFTEGLVYVNPESSSVRLAGGKKTFKISVQNRSSKDLFDVKLSVSHPVLDVKVEPASLFRLTSGEKSDFQVKIALKAGRKEPRCEAAVKVFSRKKAIYGGGLYVYSDAAGPAKAPAKTPARGRHKRGGK